ncbi:MAG: C40 family peptidase [Coriobacteriales bacterium]|nr:C40 family peptidase [Coriobacteriales bacterium]
MNRRKFIGGAAASALAVCLGNVLLPASAFAEPTSAEKQAEADEVQKKLDDWAEQLDKASNDYYRAIEAHDSAIASMEEAQGLIESAETRVSTIQNRLGDRAVSMYKQGQIPFFEVLFGAHSFSEFTSSWDMLDNINDSDSEMIEEGKQAKQDAQDARDEYSMQEQIAQQKLDEAEEIRITAEETVAAYESELASLEEEIARLIEEEEERRRLAEEAAARAAAAAQGGSAPQYSANWEYAPYNGESYGSVIEAAYSRLGCPYVWGATGPNSFDCSGFVWWCYRQAGINITRDGVGMHTAAPIQLPVSAAQAGDILWNSHHVGIALGGGQYIHAPRTGDVVRVASNIGTFRGASRYA